MRGRVTEALESMLSSSRAAFDVFTCGPDRMMARVSAICSAHDVPCEASLETPMACGYGVCLGCPVPTPGDGYLYACMQGPCIDARRIDWSRSR
jgi:dihydroorotate dehydrogenase electron transfer subunit